MAAIREDSERSGLGTSPDRRLQAAATSPQNGDCFRSRRAAAELCLPIPDAGQQLIYGLRGEVWSLAQFPDRLQAQSDAYYLLDSGNGLRLDGTYKPSGDAMQPGITFTRDGQFIDEGILDSKPPPR
jgi:hypothetical protein